MNCEFRDITENDRIAVIDIFNYFIENGFSAYPEEKVPHEFFNIFLQAAKTCPVIVVMDKDDNDRVIGFGMMRTYNPFTTFRRTMLLSYFLLPQYIHKGIGRKLVKFFIDDAKRRGVDCLLAEISSLNKQSIGFHIKMGFEQCGQFKRVGRKFGEDFDVIWMQKLL
jgi:L-amino acid N-acyltransferase YncA